MQPIYRDARGRKEKTRLIKQISETLSCHKKHAGRLMRGPEPAHKGPARRRLDRYCHSTGLKRFRSRPYKKDDQAHIEQKNGTHVRRLIGWDRYDTEEAVAAMNDLFRNEWRLLTNLFLPSVKLAKKIRIGSKIKRIYGAPKTPLDRLRDSGKGDRKKIEELYKLRGELNPFELSKKVEAKLEWIWKLASHAKPPVAEVPAKRWKMLEVDNYPPLCVPFRSLEVEKVRKLHLRERILDTN